MNGRTVTVDTCDDGLITIPEPGWCLGDHPAGEYRIDIAHVGPETVIEADTPQGVAVLARAAVEQRPFTALAPGAGVFVNVEIGGEHHPCDAAALRLLGQQLLDQLGLLAELAGLLDALAAGGDR